MTVPITSADAVTAWGFFFFSVALITLAMMALGKGKADGAGTVFIFVGAINAIMGFMLLWANLASPVFIGVAFLVLIFAFTFLAAGIINIRGYDLMPLGNANILSGLMMLAFAAFFIINRAAFSTVGFVWLVVNCFSWAGLFWAITLVTHGKMQLATAGRLALVQAFYTLWIPAALLLTGVISLLP